MQSTRQAPKSPTCARLPKLDACTLQTESLRVTYPAKVAPGYHTVFPPLMACRQEREVAIEDVLILPNFFECCPEFQQLIGVLGWENTPFDPSSLRGGGGGAT
eukprot:1444797-Amphidinium_carterae.2